METLLPMHADDDPPGCAAPPESPKKRRQLRFLDGPPHADSHAYAPLRRSSTGASIARGADAATGGSSRRRSRRTEIVVGFVVGMLLTSLGATSRRLTFGSAPPYPAPAPAPARSRPSVSSLAAAAFEAAIHGIPSSMGPAWSPAPSPSRSAEEERLEGRLQRAESELAELRRRLKKSQGTEERLWGIVNDLEARTAAATSLASRETCDADELRPYCEAVASEPQNSLPARIRARTSDLRARRLWGNPADDPNNTQRNLLVLTVGMKQKTGVDSIVRAFDLAQFTVVLFHYDGAVDDWDDLPWSEDAIHVSAKKQSKWWFAKRFLHPDVVEPYDFVFLWDEDIDVVTDGFDASEYLRIARDNGLHISQPALVSGRGAWPITSAVEGVEMHRRGVDWNGAPCPDAQGNPRDVPPCAAYVEIMVPVFSRRSWRCVWTMIQNDLTHGWGLDLTWHRCAADPGGNLSAVDAMGVVDAQGVRHKAEPTLKEQGEGGVGLDGADAVGRRRAAEWDAYNSRWKTPMTQELYEQLLEHDEQFAEHHEGESGTD